jgi:methylated-DNA-protein-cysteine methyltransferase-like protein
VNRLGELSGKMHFETPYVMRERLEAENVTFIGEAVDLSRHLWIPPIAG